MFPNELSKWIMSKTCLMSKTCRSWHLTFVWHSPVKLCCNSAFLCFNALGNVCWYIYMFLFIVITCNISYFHAAISFSNGLNKKNISTPSGNIFLKSAIKPPFRLKTFITNFDKSFLISFRLVICVKPVNETTSRYLKMLSPPFLLRINYRAGLISYPQRGIISSDQSHKWNTHHGEVLSTFWGNKKVMTIFIGHCIIGKREARNAGDLSLCELLVNFN